MSAPIVVPSSCTWCAIERRGHGRQFADAVGWHEWAAPSQEQILARMKARRLALTVARVGALPMPVGPAPQVDSDLAKAPWGRGEDGRPRLPMGAHWTDIPELVDNTLAKIQGRVNAAQPGHWYDASLLETWRPPGTVCTRVDGRHRTVGRVTDMLPADVALVLHAHDDLTWCLEMVAKFRARVAELESERHSTNEALDDAVQALRERPDGITRLIAPTQALREDEATPATCADHDPAMECADGKCSCPCGKPCTCGGCCGCCTSFCSHDSYCASAWLHSGRDDA